MAKRKPVPAGPAPDGPKPLSPMFPMYLLFVHKGLYYYSSNCCVPSDPHSSQIVSNVPLTSLGCPPPGGGGGESSGLYQEGIDVNYVGAVHDGQDDQGNDKSREGIGFGFFHDDSGGFGGLPESPEDLFIEPGVGHVTAFGSGKSFQLLNDGSPVHKPDRVFRIWTVRDWYRSTLFLVALPFKKPAGLEPKELNLEEFVSGEGVDVPIYCGCGSYDVDSSTRSEPHLDVLIVDHP